MSTGFTATPANLLTVPVYTLACIVTCLVGFVADRYGQRGLINMYVFHALSLLPHPNLTPIHSACSLVGLAGYVILIASRNATLSYIGVYLAACGIYPNIPNTIAWVSNNVEGSYKRSVTLAMVISFGNINGAVSSNVVRTLSTAQLTSCSAPLTTACDFFVVASTAARTSRGTPSGTASSSCTSASR